MDYSKNIVMGKCDYNSRSRKDCTAEIQVEIRNLDSDQPVLSICGEIYHSSSRRFYTCGQCIDTMSKLIHSKKMNEILETWKRWHLNDMHAACEHHREFEKEPYEKHANHVCEICGYEYGTKWNYEKLPQEVIDKVKAW